MNKRVLIFIGVVLAGLIVLTLYIFLGGFKEVTFSIQPVSKPKVLAGVPFEGNMRSSRLDSLFEVTRQIHQSGQLKGTLGAIYYDVPLKKQSRGEINALIGVWLDDASMSLPKGFQLRTIPAGKVVQARLQAHFLVSPSPDEVQEKMRQYARQQGLQPENLVIEEYLSDESIILETPIR
jgi:hypothetical protein